jgi:hypothetical protein
MTAGRGLASKLKLQRYLPLLITVAGTCITSAILGLVLSALVRSNDQILPRLMVAVMT